MKGRHQSQHTVPPRLVDGLFGASSLAVPLLSPLSLLFELPPLPLEVSADFSVGFFQASDLGKVFSVDQLGLVPLLQRRALEPVGFLQTLFRSVRRHTSTWITHQLGSFHALRNVSRAHICVSS